MSPPHQRLLVSHSLEPSNFLILKVCPAQPKNSPLMSVFLPPSVQRTPLTIIDLPGFVKSFSQRSPQRLQPKHNWLSFNFSFVLGSYVANSITPQSLQK